LSQSPGRSNRARVPLGQEKLVIQRSGDRCAYPGCAQLLSFAAQDAADEDKVVGKVAHIKAASPNGPRYDPNMTEAERGSARNLIYLCGPHHDAVDSQTSLHTVEFLMDAKAAHESSIKRAAAYTVGEIGFDHLELVCRYLQLSPDLMTGGDTDLPLEVEEKICLNVLSVGTAERVRVGRAASGVVSEFIAITSQRIPSFGTRLAADFKSAYYAGVAQGLSGDDLFDLLEGHAIENAGPVVGATVSAAALAVITYLFETCEVFEH
jgi:hypothetical protein